MTAAARKTAEGGIVFKLTAGGLSVFILATVYAPGLTPAKLTNVSYLITREANFDLLNKGQDFIAYFKNRYESRELLTNKLDANGTRGDETVGIAILNFPVKSANLRNLNRGVNTRLKIVKIKILRNTANNAVTESTMGGGMRALSFLRTRERSSIRRFAA